MIATGTLLIFLGTYHFFLPQLTGSWFIYGIAATAGVGVVLVLRFFSLSARDNLQ
jgi:hypothetical protein